MKESVFMFVQFFFGLRETRRFIFVLIHRINNIGKNFLSLKRVQIHSEFNYKQNYLFYGL